MTKALSKHKHPLYPLWASMRRRCRCERGYADRGIKVCARWEDFWLFVADIGPRPSPSHTVDRKDNNGNYTPENCRWATTEEQNQNRRKPSKIAAPETDCATESALRARVPKAFNRKIEAFIRDWNAKATHNPINVSRLVREALILYMAKHPAKAA